VLEEPVAEGLRLDALSVESEKKTRRQSNCQYED
jgi:hypothetical protein